MTKWLGYSEEDKKLINTGRMFEKLEWKRKIKKRIEELEKSKTAKYRLTMVEIQARIKELQSLIKRGKKE